MGLTKTEITRYDRKHPVGESCSDTVIQERPLTLDVNGTTYTLLRTPGTDRELAVGFLFTEGLIARLDDILLLGECPDSPDAINIKISDTRVQPRRSLLITSSCGLCGREDIQAMVDALGRVESAFQIPLATVYLLPATVRQLQPLFDATGGAHASALFDATGRILGVKEDVGRHNALDKLIGHALLRALPLNNLGVFLSGRTSLELITKAARARIPLLAAVGAPTATAVEAADRLGITLCGFLRDERISVYSQGGRITLDTMPLLHQPL